MAQFVDRANQTGSKYYRLTLQNEFRKIKRGLSKKRTQILWLFICECQNEVWARYDSVVSGKVKSCGCQRSHAHKKEYGLSSKKRKYRGYKRTAKKKKLAFTLSFEKFIDITSSNCYYCNCPPSNIQRADGNNGDYVYNGIDRVDNDKGYIDDNCVPCCSPCNNAKKHLPAKDFLALIEAIYLHRIKKD